MNVSKIQTPKVMHLIHNRESTMSPAKVISSWICCAEIPGDEGVLPAIELCCKVCGNLDLTSKLDLQPMYDDDSVAEASLEQYLTAWTICSKSNSETASVPGLRFRNEPHIHGGFLVSCVGKKRETISMTQLPCVKRCVIFAPGVRKPKGPISRHSRRRPT